jgi:NTE family protein
LGADFFPKVVEFFLPESNIEELPIPFGCVATDINSGEPVEFIKGPLRQSVAASCAVPGASPVARLNGRNLVDGGVVALVPISLARKLYDGPVVAVNVIQRSYEDEVPDQAVDVYLRAMELQGMHLNHLILEEADLIITPEVGGIHWADFKRAEQAMDAGREAAQKVMPAIRNLARPQKIWHLGYWQGRGKTASA